MNRTAVIIGLVLGIGMGLLAGQLFLHGKRDDPGDGLSATTGDADARDAAHSGEGTGDPQPLRTKPFGIESDVRTRDEMIRRIAELEQQTRKLKSDNDDLTAQLGALEELKKEKAESVRKRLAELAKIGLGAFGRPGDLAQLVGDLRSLGEQGVTMALDLLNSENPSERFFAAKLLEDLNDPRAIPDLKQRALEDDDEMTRNMASHALAFMKSPDVVASLRDVYKESKAAGVRVNSLAGLAIHNDPQGITDTVAFIGDKEQPRNLRQAMAGILILPHEHLMPVADAVRGNFSSSGQILGLAVNFYATVGTPAARQRLQAMANDPSLPQAVRDEARRRLDS